MSERVERIYNRLNKNKTFPICVEKAKIVTDSYKRNDGLPMILKRAVALAEFAEQRTIFIEDGELLIGNVASRPQGMELAPHSPAWPDEDLAKLLNGTGMTLTEEDHKTLRELDAYWLEKKRSFDERMNFYIYSTPRVQTFLERGITVPKYSGSLMNGSAGEGLAFRNPIIMMVPDYGMMMKKGFAAHVQEAKDKLASLHFDENDSFEKANFLNATIIAYEGFIKLGRRYAELAEKEAAACIDPIRKKELEEIAQVCHQVPEFPARTFREAMQALTFYWNMFTHGTTGLGRMDQYLYPYYKSDVEKGLITHEEAVELLALFRVKVMQCNFIRGARVQRDKWAGMARWNNVVIGGCDQNGNDATNEVSHMIIEAANLVPTPHHTITVRVNKHTDPQLMKEAVDLVSTGIGFPAFISEDEYIGYLVKRGVPLKTAREFAISGCLDIAIPGKSRASHVSMFALPIVFELTMHNGKDPSTGKQIGLQTGTFEDFKSYEEFYEAFMKQMDYFIGIYSEYVTIKTGVDRELFPDAVTSGFYSDALDVCKDITNRVLPYENNVIFNLVGAVDAINSFAALKGLVYDQKVCTPAEMKDALDKNWEGHEELYHLCKNYPKYGNAIDEVDKLGEKMWEDLAELVHAHKNQYGKPVIIGAISITSHAPGGAITGATPDGRRAGETLADGSVSPAAGTDTNGPLAVLNSASHMCHGVSCDLLNMKFSPTSLATDEDKQKLSAMIITYLNNGGKHIQFNVVDTETLKQAKLPENRAEYSDLIVRVAGYSAYFVTLTDRVQDEIIARTEQTM